MTLNSSINPITQNNTGTSPSTSPSHGADASGSTTGGQSDLYSWLAKDYLISSALEPADSQMALIRHLAIGSPHSFDDTSSFL